MTAHPVQRPASADVFSENEFKIMARLLERQQGSRAAEIAAFFALEHQMLGDAGRASAWTSVASELHRGLNCDTEDA